MERSTWVDISSEALASNFRAVKKHAGTKVCAVVKANAYGHGIEGASRIFADAGADMLGVTRLEEARRIRSADIDVPLLMMSPTPDQSEAVKLGCELAVTSRSEIDSLPQGTRAHLKFDTGMGRLGFNPDTAVEVASKVAERGEVVAIWTHFANPDRGAIHSQLNDLLEIRETLAGSGIDCEAHAASSSAVLLLPDSFLDMVRVGTLLYGYNLSPADPPFTLRNAFDWYARVASVKELKPGARVGYRGEWRAHQRTIVGTLPIGYADGVTVQPLGRSETIGEAVRIAGGMALLAMGRRPSQRVVYFGEIPAPVLGRVGMQAITVSLEGLPEIGVGSVARIPARNIMVNSSIERVYV